MSATTVPTIGLTNAEVEKRQAAGLGNTVSAPSSRTYRDIVRSNLFTFINITLIGIGILLVILGQPRDALMASGLAIINAALFNGML